jgi:hypothetical protein
VVEATAGLPGLDIEDDLNDPGHEECAIRDPDPGHEILFIEVPEPKSVKNRIQRPAAAHGRP